MSRCELGEPNDMRTEGKENLFGWGITSGEVNSVVVMVFRIAADSLPPRWLKRKIDREEVTWTIKRSCY